MKGVYYNDNDPFVCAWLRNLIRAGHVPAGEVDERPIQEVTLDDIQAFAQVHFFAGIGGWAHALERAGWGPGPVWTGSCPCQPFSPAGKGQAEDDPRHLWPEWARLIRERRPSRIFGEQVADAAGFGWLDLVSTELEAEAYTVGAVVLGAHSVGAPHRRHRLYFVAHTEDADRRPGKRGAEARARTRGLRGRRPAGGRALGLLADGLEPGLEGHAGDVGDGDQPGRLGAHAPRPAPTGGGPGGLGHAEGNGRGAVAERSPSPAPTGEGARLERARESGELGDTSSGGRGERGDAARPGDGRHAERTGGTGLGGLAYPGDERRGEAGAPEGGRGIGGSWDGAVWIRCRDGKHRLVPVEPALFPLAPRLPNRVGLLRGAGNAIVPEVAEAFIRTAMSCLP